MIGLRTIILICGLVTCRQVHAQLILTEEENVRWIEQIKSEKELGSQLATLRTRILADTGVFVRPLGDRSILRTDENMAKQEGLCRPILIVEGNIISITNSTNSATVENIAKLLTTDKVKQIEIVDGERAKALFGQNGLCGVVLLLPSGRKAKKEFLRYKI